MNANIHRLLAVCGIIVLNPGALLADFQHTTGSGESYYVEVSVPCCAHYHQHGTAYGDSSNYIRGYGPLGGFDLNAPQYLDLSGEIAADRYDIHQEVGGEGYICVEITWDEPPVGEPVDPFADTDENGVGDLGEFTLEDRTSGLSTAAEWLGVAVGIFVEPVDWVLTIVEIYRDPANLLSYLGIIPGVPAGAGKLVKKAANLASDVLRAMPQGVIIKIGTKTKGMKHILMRHHHLSTAQNVSRFAPGMGQREITDLLHDALNRGGTWVDDTPTTKLYHVEMPNNIGTDVTGNPTNKLRIVVDKATNEVITAFPVDAFP